MCCPEVPTPAGRRTPTALHLLRGSASRWVCRRCAKVSEGFLPSTDAAPHCGGELRRCATTPNARTARPPRWPPCASPSRSSSAGALSTSAPPQTDDWRWPPSAGRWRWQASMRGSWRAATWNGRTRRRSSVWRCAAIFADVEHRPEDRRTCPGSRSALEKARRPTSAGAVARRSSGRRRRDEAPLSAAELAADRDTRADAEDPATEYGALARTAAQAVRRRTPRRRAAGARLFNRRASGRWRPARARTTWRWSPGGEASQLRPTARPRRRAPPP